MSVFKNRTNKLVIAALTLLAMISPRAEGIYDYPLTEEKYAQWTDATKSQMLRDYAQSIQEGCTAKAEKDPRNEDSVRRLISVTYCGCLSKIIAERTSVRQLYEMLLKISNPSNTEEINAVAKDYAIKGVSENEELVWKCTESSVQSLYHLDETKKPE